MTVVVSLMSVVDVVVIVVVVVVLDPTVSRPTALLSAAPRGLLFLRHWRVAMKQLSHNNAHLSSYDLRHNSSQHNSQLSSYDLLLQQHVVSLPMRIDVGFCRMRR